MRLCVAFLLAVACRAESPVFALVAEFDRLAAKPLWPGFDARTTPVELYDGVNTYLLRHPAPPKEFTAVAGHAGFLMYAGRHATVRANTSIELAGHITATLSFEKADTNRAAVLVHECFHVFQARNHPSWSANEATLFTYPAENAAALGMARLEMEALKRALKGDACWAARARALRRQRFALLPADAVEYERGTELKEGLAQYVEGLAAGREEARFGSFGPEDVRLRGYASGEALGRLLDRLAPGWKAKIGNSLDELLPEADAAGCDFTAAEREAAEAQARADVEKLVRARGELQQAFDAQPGWRLTVEAAAGKPLGLGGFDPINVARISGQVVLHKRYLKLQNEGGTLEILNHGSMTEAAGAHPLFNGVRRWTTAGLTARPEVRRDGDRVSVAGAEVNLSFANAEVETREQSIVIRLR